MLKQAAKNDKISMYVYYYIKGHGYELQTMAIFAIE